ncbi:MAG: ATP-binding protein [Aggregatilineales bacterium]
MKLESPSLNTSLSLFSGIVLAMAGAIMVVATTLRPGAEDMAFLILFMSGTGFITISVSYLLYRRGLARWFRSLRWALLVTVVLTVVLIFVNVWVTARLMFISYHDLALTTALLLYAGVTAIVFGFFISRTITDSIGELATTAEKIAQGDLTARLDVRGNDELAKLAETFNWMASNLQEIDDQKRMIEQTRRNLIAWVSHDLRTPLASMRVMIEAMLDGVVDDEATRTRYLENSRAEIEHLNSLINDLFELAQIDVGHLKLDYQVASMCDLISDTIGTMTARARQKQVVLDGKVSPSIDPVNMAPDKIQRVLYNLLDNALQHTPEGGSIMLNAYVTNAEAIRVDVYNSGSIIAKDDLPHIFSSFYRGERSRARDNHGTRGAGLGLAITRGFVEAHGGKIWLEANSQNGGITFSFTIPRTSKKITVPAITP